MKFLKHITTTVFITILSLYILVYSFFSLPLCQDFLRSSVEQALMNKLHTQLHIGSIDIGLFNRVTLNNVVILDQKKNKLFESDLVSCRIELAPLLHQEISLRTITIVDGQINAYKNTEKEDYNYQFVLNAFKSSNRQKKSDINLRINSIILRRLAIRFDQNYKSRTPGRFNPHHINLAEINANISLKKLLADSLRVRIRDLSLREASGIRLQHFAMDLQANKKMCQIENLRIEMPKSLFIQDKVLIAYQWTDNGPKNFKAKLSVSHCKISSLDFAALAPQLKSWNDTFLLTGDIHFLHQQITLKSLILKNISKTLNLHSDITYKWNDSIKRVRVDKLHIQSNNTYLPLLWSQIHPHKLVPKAIENLGGFYVDAKGDLISKRKNTYANLSFQLNSVHGKMICPQVIWENHMLIFPKELSGTLNLKNIIPAAHVSTVNFGLKGKCVIPNGKIQDGIFSLALHQLTWHDYPYKNINVEGNYKHDNLSINMQVLDKNANIELNGILTKINQAKKGFSFQLNIAKLEPRKLNLPRNLTKIGRMSGRITASSHSLDLNAPELSLQINDLSYQKEGSEEYKTDSIVLKMWNSAGNNHLYFKSDFLDINASGNYSYANIKQLIPSFFKKSFKSLLPSLDKILNNSSPNKWGAFNARLKNTDFFKNVLNLNLHSQNGGYLYGKIDNKTNNILIEGDISDVSFASEKFKNLRLYCNGKDEKVRLLVQGTKINKKNEVQVAAEFNANQSVVDIDLRLKNGSMLNGFISATSDLKTFAQDKILRTNIHQSKLYVEDTAWIVHPSVIELKNGKLRFENFEINNAQQYININGALSSSPTDSMKIDLHNIDLNYVLDLVNFHSVEFGGHVSGQAYLSQSLSSPQLTYKINANDFQFNKASLGRLHALGSWDKKDGKIKIHAQTTASHNQKLNINGIVSIKDKSLDLNFDAYNTTIQFLKPYVENIFTNIEGNTSGHLRLFGPFKKLDFEGNHRVEMDATIATTGCRYHFQSDSVKFRPGAFEFGEVELTDHNGKKATANGYIKHNHLKNLTYDFQIDFRNFLVYDQPRTADMPFYATVPATGHVFLNGSPGRFSADIDINPEKGTEFVYIMDVPTASSGDRQLLTFVSHSSKDSVEKVLASADSQTDIMLNINVNANANAAIKLIMDEKTGDYILMHGNGNLRTYYYNKGKFSMFGTYTVEDGIYKMILQNIIRKDFVFSPGGTINFTGDPRNAALSLKAIYTVNSVSLSDLNPKGNFSNNNVKVNCILNLNGQATAPRISFDLDLPTVGEDEKRMVKYLINTEEGMNMQIIYLLGIGRFYTYDVSSNSSTTQNQSSLAIQSFLSNTLSSHLNNVLSNAIGVKNWTFGTNFSTGTSGWEDMEIEGLLNGRLLNNQLLINGNFGYRDKSTYSTNNFIGDFDVQWLLNPAGTIRLKAYSETNDRYFTKSTLTTQGIGILLKRDFDTLRDLFLRRKNLNK